MLAADGASPAAVAPLLVTFPSTTPHTHPDANGRGDTTFSWVSPTSGETVTVTVNDVLSRLQYPDLDVSDAMAPIESFFPPPPDLPPLVLPAREAATPAADHSAAVYAAYVAHDAACTRLKEAHAQAVQIVSQELRQRLQAERQRAIGALSPAERLYRAIAHYIAAHEAGFRAQQLRPEFADPDVFRLAGTVSLPVPQPPTATEEPV